MQKSTSVRAFLIFTAAVCLTFSVSEASSRRESYGDFRDAITLLDAAMRSYGDKLERHEGRERQLGDTLRRSLVGIDKRVAMLQRTSEERARELERFMLQAEERERIQLQKTAQGIEALGSMLETRLSRIEALVEASSKNAGEATETPCVQSAVPKVETLEKRMEMLEGTIANGTKEMVKSTEYISKFEENLNFNLDKSIKILEQLSNTNGNMNQDSGPKEGSGELRELIVQVSENLNSLSTQAQEAHNDAVKAMSETATALTHIEQEIKSQSEKKAELLIQKFNEIHNSTLTAVGELTKGNETKEDTEERAENMDAILSDISSVRDEIKTLLEMNEAIKKDLQSDIQSVGSESQKATSDMQEAVIQKIGDAVAILSPEPLLKTLTDMEHVMLQAADGVMDVGRRVEYSAARVIGELSEEIKSKSAVIEETIASRLDNLAASVLVNQTGAMETLSQKVESEISQVWRQIGIMYQQLTQSVGMLDKLQVQTEHYVNGSLKSMGTVQGRVGEIGERVGEVEGNLNYLLGRLSLVSTEFNLVKAGLAEALDDVRRNMATVNNNIRETAPGTEYDHINQVLPGEGQ